MNASSRGSIFNKNKHCILKSINKGIHDVCDIKFIYYSLAVTRTIYSFKSLVIGHSILCILEVCIRINWKLLAYMNYFYLFQMYYNLLLYNSVIIIANNFFHFVKGQLPVFRQQKNKNDACLGWTLFQMKCNYVSYFLYIN